MHILVAYHDPDGHHDASHLAKKVGPYIAGFVVASEGSAKHSLRSFVVHTVPCQQVFIVKLPVWDLLDKCVTCWPCSGIAINKIVRRSLFGHAPFSEVRLVCVLNYCHLIVSIMKNADADSH